MLSSETINDLSESARIFLDRSSVEFGDGSEKWKVKRLFANSLLYLDIVEKERNQRFVSSESAFDSDSDESEEEDDDDDDDDDFHDFPHDAENSVLQTAYVTGSFGLQNGKKGYENCFMPPPRTETSQSQLDGAAGPGETRTAASELVSSSDPWKGVRYSGKRGSCPVRPKTSNDGSSPHFSTQQFTKNDPDSTIYDF